MNSVYDYSFTGWLTISSLQTKTCTFVNSAELHCFKSCYWFLTQAPICNNGCVQIQRWKSQFQKLHQTMFGYHVTKIFRLSIILPCRTIQNKHCSRSHAKELVIWSGSYLFSTNKASFDISNNVKTYQQLIKWTCSTLRTWKDVARTALVLRIPNKISKLLPIWETLKRKEFATRGSKFFQVLNDKC